MLKAKEYGILLWSEIELAASMFDADYCCYGTNGKTTTTSLLGRMFVDGEFLLLLQAISVSL